jgi:putative NIF3 family GTP cyclohydrolase 1 type 2
MPLTIQQAIDTIFAAVPGAPFPGTMDTIKLGDPKQPLKGVALTFLASIEAIEEALRLGANLLITHEPTFYNHPDETDWLAANPVYIAKRRLAEDAGLVIWRFHDTLHRIKPDPTMAGMAHELGWETYLLPGQPNLCWLPAATTLRELAQHVKDQLGATGLRVIGDLDRPCQTVGLLPGAPGPRAQVGVLSAPGVDALITGEIFEWETSEFARDALHLKLGKGLIITGHAASEEPGMRRMVPWLEQRLPGVPVQFIGTHSAFQTV